MEHVTTQRILCSHLQDASASAAALRWTERLPGMILARVQAETGELVVTYDLGRTTLAAIRRHLQRGGVACDGSLIQRCHLLRMNQRERTARRALGLEHTRPAADLPLIPCSQAA